MKSPAYVAVSLLLLASLAAAESSHRQLVEALLRFGAEHVGPKVLPTLKHSRVGDVGTTADGDVVIDKYSFTLQSAAQNVDGELSNVTVTDLSSLKLESKGKSLLLAVDMTIEGEYSLYGTSNDATLEAQGGFTMQMTDFEYEAAVNYTLIDSTRFALDSVDLKVSAPSIKVTYENFIIDVGAVNLLKDLLRH